MTQERERVVQPLARRGIGRVRRLLVCLDRSAFSEASLPLAVSIARAFDGRIKLVHVLEPPVRDHSGPTDALAWELSRAEAAEHLERVAARVRAGGVPVDTVLRQGHAAEQVLCLSDREEIDLIVITSHGEKGVTEWGLSSMAHKIIERARASVLIVPAAVPAPPPVPEARVERLLVLLDGSPHAESALAPALRLARARGAALVLLHVVPPTELPLPSPHSEEDEDLLRRLGERNERVAREYLERICEQLACDGCEVRGLLEKGDVRKILREVAGRERIDLVLFAAHGRTGDRSRPCGATANDLVHHVALPVFMVQNLPQPRSEFAGAVRHAREAVPLRGGSPHGRP